LIVVSTENLAETRRNVRDERPSGKETTIQAVHGSLDGCHGDKEWFTKSQPRPQGFSLKKWVGREKALALKARHS